jgi:hypothetical protein
VPLHDWARVHAAIFHDFHHGWVADLRRALQRDILPRDYYALLANLADGVGPGAADLVRPGGGLDVADKLVTSGIRITDEPKWFALNAKAVTVRRAKNHQVVSAVVIVSPGDKDSAESTQAFVRKAKELLTAGVHLTVIDLFPPGPHNPGGIHPLIWCEESDDTVRIVLSKTLSLASYVGGPKAEAYLESVAIGDRIPDTPLFLATDLYVEVPLERTYQSAFDAIPDVWREVLESPHDG